MAEPTETELNDFERQLLDRLREVYGAKRWLVAGEIAQGIAGAVVTARDYGATDAIAIASRFGVGEVPDDVRFIISDDSQAGDNASMLERLHDNNRELHNLPAWVIDEVDDWDPDREAAVIVSFTIDEGLVADRPTFGARKPAWTAIEDKITIRDVWRRAGVTTAPDRVVDLIDVDGLVDAHHEIASRAGTVWAVDNDQGWHGGSAGTHWVATPEQARALAAELAARHTQVRIQPFLTGVPCSIHGMVLRDATLAFRPCEMIMLVDPDDNSFHYSRAATFWDPASDDRDKMRAATRAIGNTLRELVDYRGVFTLDGVMTEDGFLPTEVNPRFGAALPARLPASDGSTLHLFFTHLAAVAGHLDDLDPTMIEALIVNRLDATRAGGAFARPSHGPPNDEQLSVALTGTWLEDRFVDVRAVTPDEDVEPFANASWGPDPDGGLIVIFFTTAMPTGPPVALTLVEMRSFLNSHWGLGLPNLVASCAQ